jgi:transposase
MKPRTESNTASLAVVGIDIGKDVFHLIGFGADGKIAFRRRIRRLGLKDVFEKLPPCIVGMEACLSAHFVSRALRALGHEPRIIPAIYVKPFVKGQKNHSAPRRAPPGRTRRHFGRRFLRVPPKSRHRWRRPVRRGSRQGH